jgi:glutamate synthase domain-containing protein 2/glutamate synthase domain-containing protein 3
MQTDVLEKLRVWEEILALVVDPGRSGRDSKDHRILNQLLRRADIDVEGFWALSPSRRSRQFLETYSRSSRDLRRLEVSSFDLDRVAKERFRSEPLTVGAAWHHGYWRSYFSHAAITHPANDGLREEFSTAWDILRRQPAVVQRTASGREVHHTSAIQLDLPILVGPLPHSDGLLLERAYVDAICQRDPQHDLRVKTRVIVDSASYRAQEAYYRQHHERLLVRLPAQELMPNPVAREAGGWELVRQLAADSALVEVDVPESVPVASLLPLLQRLHTEHAELMVSVYLHYGPQFWTQLLAAAQQENVAMLHVHAGEERSYRLVPRIDELLKKARLRSRLQVVTAGGTHDTISSASAVYEAVLLGANGGSISHLAQFALSPDFADVARGDDPRPLLQRLAEKPPEELRELALSTLTCWQHSILDFLSCMGIDDIQKTSGNTMAITMTEDWVRNTDALATREFGERNREQNRRRLEAEPIPAAVRADFRVSKILQEVDTDVPLVLAARLLAQRNANYHLMNTNQSLSADHLEVIYKMAAGRFPEVEDFFPEGPLGDWSMDAIGVRLSRRSIEASLQALRSNPAALDYINLCVPRGFHRPGAVDAHASCVLARDAAGAQVVHTFRADASGSFHETVSDVEGSASLWVLQKNGRGQVEKTVELKPVPERQPGQPRPASAPPGMSVRWASEDHGAFVRVVPDADRYELVGTGIREPLYTGPVNHASISLGAAGEDFLLARVEGNAGLSITSSGEGGPLRLPAEIMRWESLQAASGHFGLTGEDLRQVRDVEIKINQGAKPGKGGRLAGHKVTPTVSRARNIPVGTNALSPDPKHDIYSIEDMPAEVWLWMQYGVHCGIKITGSSYTRFVAAGMWSNFVVDYLLVDAGLGGSGNYHADSSRVGWPDVFRTILHTHHALMDEPLFDPETGRTHSIRDLNGRALGAGGGTKLLASGGLRSEMDMLKVLLAGADGLLEASIGKAVAFGCNQCGNCHIDCPRGGITTKVELTLQNDRRTMVKRFRNWTALNMVKLGVLIDAINREMGTVNKRGQVVDERQVIDDIRKLRGRTDLLIMPKHNEAAPDIVVPELADLQAAVRVGEESPSASPSERAADAEAGLPDKPSSEIEHDSCRVGSLLVSEPVDVEAIWEAARLSLNGGNNRGGGIAFGGFTPDVLRHRTCMVFNTIGPDRAETMQHMLDHLEGLRLFDVQGREMDLSEVKLRLPEFRVPVRALYQGDEGWRRAGLLEDVGDVTMLFTELRGDALWRFGHQLLDSPHWVQRRLKHGHRSTEELEAVIDNAVRREEPFVADDRTADDLAFLRDVKEEYFMTLAHILDTRYYRTGGPQGKTSDKRRGYVVSMGEDMAAIKISGWTHLIPSYFDFASFWAGYPGAREQGGVRRRLKGEETWTSALLAHVWGMHHRYPTNSPAMDTEGRGNPAGAHPFKAYNVLLMHNGEQVGVDSTAPMLMEHSLVHTDESMGPGHEEYAGDSLYERKALTDTEYAAYLVDFTRRVLGLPTDEATQIISPITGIDLEGVQPEERRERYRILSRNYVQLTPTGPYKFTIVETRHTSDGQRVGFRENMDIKFLRPHEIAVNWDTAQGGAQAVANGSEAKIADSMLGVLRKQGVLPDAGSDLRFNMRPGGRPQSGEMGGVFEAFVDPRSNAVDLHNRFGETVDVPRAGRKPHALRGLQSVVSGVHKPSADEVVERLGVLQDAPGSAAEEEFTRWVLAQVPAWDFDAYRYLAEAALPRWAAESDSHRAAAVRILTELRKRLQLCDTGGKSLSALQYFTDGGFEYDGEPEGGLYRLFAAVPHLWTTQGKSLYSRIDFDSRLDLVEPQDASRILVVDMQGFRSEAFGREGAARFLAEAVRCGWRHLVTFNYRGGPRYLGTNLADHDKHAVRDALIEVYGPQSGDFLGALLEGSEIRCYGQGQSHVGMKMDQGSIFVLDDILNTGLYAAHGGNLSVWDSGSRFAVAGQNRVYEDDGSTLAPGLKSIHFGSPNEYAFEYLMSGGDNSMHVVMGLEKPDARGQLQLRRRPYAGKFFMSGAAAGRVFVFDPEKRMQPEQVRGNEAAPVTVEEWDEALGAFVASAAAERGLPIEVQPGGLRILLHGTWREYSCDEAFTRYQPISVPRSVLRQGIAPPALVNMVPE